MGYRDRRLTVDLSALADGCYVTMRNPLLLGAGAFEDPGDASNDRERERIGRRYLSQLIVDWQVYADDDSDEPEALPLPTSETADTVFDRVPSVVVELMWRAVGDARKRMRALTAQDAASEAEKAAQNGHLVGVADPN